MVMNQRARGGQIVKFDTSGVNRALRVGGDSATGNTLSEDPQNGQRETKSNLGEFRDHDNARGDQGYTEDGAMQAFVAPTFISSPDFEGNDFSAVLAAASSFQSSRL